MRYITRPRPIAAGILVSICAVACGGAPFDSAVDSTDDGGQVTAANAKPQSRAKDDAATLDAGGAGDGGGDEYSPQNADAGSDGGEAVDAEALNPADAGALDADSGLQTDAGDGAIDACPTSDIRVTVDYASTGIPSSCACTPTCACLLAAPICPAQNGTYPYSCSDEIGTLAVTCLE